MDCGICETAGPVVIQQPEVVDVQLTITENAQTMLDQAFGDDKSMALLVGVLSGLFWIYVRLQMVDNTEIDCRELTIAGFRIGAKLIKSPA